MKKYIKILVASLSIGVFQSCNYLDVSSELDGDVTTFEQIFNNVEYTKRWYANIYDQVPDYTSSFSDQGMTNIWSAYADEIYTRHAATSGKYLNWSSKNDKSHRWDKLYQCIRQANIFIEKVHAIEGEMGANAVKLTQAEVDRYIANARFMRALYHYYLMELYGPIPIVKRSYILDEDNDLPRNSLDEVIDFIDTELLDCMEDMALEPYHNQEDYRGVPTKGTALAVRAKLWMYAASPLFNGGYTEMLSLKNKDGKALYSPEDVSKKQKALDACKDFIDYAESGSRYELYKNTGTFDANKSVYEVFQNYNNEIIWATSKTSWGGLNNANVDRYSTPRSETNGIGDIAPLQELVDDFYMADGMPIKATSFLPQSLTYSESGFTDVNGIDVFNMYIGREPRFYNTIAYCGMKWHITNREVQFYMGGNADRQEQGCPLSGYLLYKRYNRTISKTSPGVTSKFRPNIIFRLAEFYLLYAEALNELDPGNSDVLKYVNLVRQRAGLPNIESLNPSISGNKNLQREVIRRESRIELATEGQRYFNVKRWMIAENAVGEGGLGGDFHGMNLDGNKVAFHTRTKFNTRVFKRHHYFYPIPLAEMQKSNMLVQNPGW